MMKTNLKFNNPDEQDDFVQSLTLKELKKMNNNNEFLFQNKEEITPETESENLDLEAIDDYIQKLQLKELKKKFSLIKP